MGGDAAFIAALGILATCVGGLLWVIKFVFTKLIPAIDHLTDATKRNTLATKSADEYLRQRNGRDNEMHGQVLGALKAIPGEMKKLADSSVEQVGAIVQNISRQTVETQIVKNKE